jgi:hypothetical protein
MSYNISLEPIMFCCRSSRLWNWKWRQNVYAVYFNCCWPYTKSMNMYYIYVCGKCRTQFLLPNWGFIYFWKKKKEDIHWTPKYEVNMIVFFKSQLIHVFTEWHLSEIYYYRINNIDSNMGSFFRFVKKPERLGIISLAHAPVHVTDFTVVYVHVEQLKVA